MEGNTETEALAAAGRTPEDYRVRPPGQLWCRRCGLPVTVTGPDPDLAKAVHTATGSETGPPGGHLAAPTGTDPAARSARGGSR